MTVGDNVGCSRLTYWFGLAQKAEDKQLDGLSMESHAQISLGWDPCSPLTTWNRERMKFWSIDFTNENSKEVKIG